MYNSNTKIARWPLNIADLQAITGSSNQDIGNAIRTGAPVAQGGNGAINQWARYKPIRDSRYTPLTEQDLANADYGFDFSSAAAGGDGAFVKGTWDEMKVFMTHALACDARWKYLAPRSNATDKYRITDFTCPANRSGANGYNGNAKAPFSADSAWVRIAGGGELPVSVTYNVNAEIPLNLLHTLLQHDGEHDFDEYLLAAMIRKGDNPATTKMFIPSGEKEVRLVDMMNGDIDATQFVRIVLDNADATNHVLFVGTTCPASAFPGGVWDGETEIDHEFTFWLPNCIEIVQVSAIANTVSLTFGDNYFFRVRTLNGIMQDISAEVRVSNLTASQQEVFIYVDIQYYDDQGGFITEDQLSLEEEIINVNTSRNLNMGTNQIPDPISSEEGYDISNIGVKVRWEWSPTSYHTEHRFFDFDTCAPVASDPGFKRLSDIAQMSRYNDKIKVIPIS